MCVRKRLLVAGCSILVIGLSYSAFILLTLPPDDNADILGIDIPTKRDIYQMERIGGRANVIGIQLTSWFTSLWHGRKLAYTICCLSVVAFLLLYLLSNPFKDLSITISIINNIITNTASADMIYA